MRTYQDLQAVTFNTASVQQFVFDAITDYKGEDAYRDAIEGIAYSKGNNTAISEFKKLLYTITGEAVPDNYSANHKCASGFFHRLTCQLSSFLLSNGVTFEQDNTKDKLDINLDTKLLNATQNALVQGAVYGFYNQDHIDYFTASEFVPLFDEETGALRAGIRFWQISDLKPLRATLYEEDGYTEYIKSKGEIKVLREKTPYKLILSTSAADGTRIVDGMNYDAFPIVPLYANNYKVSELNAIKSQIDAFDLIKSGFANDLDDASMIYWTINNAGGMTDIDLAKFVERIKVLKSAAVSDEAKAEAHTIEVPYQSRETYLSRLEADITKDFMGLNIETLSAGNVTATQIRAAYENINEKADRLENSLIEHLRVLMQFAGVNDYPKFKRSQMANMMEETQMIMQCANILDTQTILEHLPFITVDEVPLILERLQQEEMARTQNSGFIDGGNNDGNDDGLNGTE